MRVLTESTITLANRFYSPESHLKLVSKQEIFGVDAVALKLTYRDAHSLAWKIGQVALAILLTLATLFISLCFQKGRALWTNSINRFIDQKVLVIRPLENPKAVSEQAPFQHQNTIAPSVSISLQHPQPLQYSLPSQPPKSLLQLPVQIPRILSKEETELNIVKEKILLRNPGWDLIAKQWQDLSVEEEVWILRLFELRQMKDYLDTMKPVLSSVNTLLGTTDPSVLIQSNQVKELISQKVKFDNAFDLIDRLLVCSIHQDVDCLCLLKNLTDLNLAKCQLKACPDISKNLKLKKLDLSENQLSIPPDLSKNHELEILYLNSNELITPPDLTQNLKLKYLTISYNKLTKAPDLTKNRNLQKIRLNNNCLPSAPDLSQNTLLTDLFLHDNLITTNIDLSFNEHLKHANLARNQLTSLPKLHRNIHTLFLSGNKLTGQLDLRTLTNLTDLQISENELTSVPLFADPPPGQLRIQRNPMTSGAIAELKVLKQTHYSWTIE